MTGTLPSLAEQYTAALYEYLEGSGEAALSRAYELGREAMSGGLGVLDVATIYRDAVAEAVLRGGATAAGFARAAEFFAESLAPFEMTFRGYVEANQRLQELNRTLAAQNVELRSAKGRADAAIQDLESFSYSVSHDLRAPLRSINGFCGILLADFLDRLPLEAQAHLRRVADAGKRMDALIQDLLQFSRLGTASLTRRPIDMNRIVRDAFEELRQAHPDRRIELRLQSLPETVADPSMLTQVVVNLLSNAIKFTRSREVAVIEVGARSERAETLYSVADNGAGFEGPVVELSIVMKGVHSAQALYDNIII